MFPHAKSPQVLHRAIVEMPELSARQRTGLDRPQTNVSPSIKTSLVERLLIVVAIVILPAENHFRFIPGFSLPFFIFGAMAIYLVINRPSELLRMFTHPVFSAAYLFVVVGTFLELTSPNADLSEIVRIIQMVVGAIVIASLCRDLPALRSACHGYLLAGVWLSILLIMSTFGVLTAATTSDFQEASKLRQEAFAESPLQANLNNMAFGAAQGAVVALCWALAGRAPAWRFLAMGLGLLCVVGAFMPLSRGGVVIMMLSCVTVMYVYGLRHAKAILMAMLLGAMIVMVVPQSVWSRMSFTFEEHEGKREGRARVYQAAIDHFPEYVLTGVGAGNFYSSWGRRSQFSKMNGGVVGSHNCLVQVTLYWGILGLTAFLLIYWFAYRCVPRFCKREATALAVAGLGISVLLYSMVIHNLYAKEFSIVLGLLAGAHRWIWPLGVVPRVSDIRQVRVSHVR